MLSSPYPTILAEMEQEWLDSLISCKSVSATLTSATTKLSAGVAQLEEHLSCKQGVAGSTPVTGPS